MKEIAVYAAMAVSAANFIWYMYTIYYGRTRPHLYTWLIWGLVCAIAAFAQFAGGGGQGAWIWGAVAVFCLIRAAAAVRHGVRVITLSDKVCLGLACVAIVAWQLAEDPLIAILIVTGIDLAGFYPTMRHLWYEPYDENLVSYVLFAVVYSLNAYAQMSYNVTTLTYPLVMIAATLGFIGYAVWRRSVFQRST